MKYIIGSIFAIITLVTVIVAYIVVQKALHNQAIDGCLQAGRLSFVNEQKYQATTPDGYWFDYCMKEKGYKTSN